MRSKRWNLAKCFIYDPKNASGQCDREVVARGRCMSHYQALLVGFGVRGKALTEQLEAERRPHWEYEGREAELIEMTEKQAEQEGAKP
jgi:hypothetical protein